MDFRKGKTLGEEIDADYEPLRFGSGYDHNWVLKNEGRFDKVAEVTADRSGIRDVDALIIAVAHEEFSHLDKAQISGCFRPENQKKVLVDIKGILDRKEYQTEDYIYWRL